MIVNDIPESSDSGIAAGDLPHARSVTFDEPLELENGGALPAVTVVYETWGTLNADRSNAVLVCHALTGDSHAASHGAEDDPGWWELFIGPGKPVDTDRLFVICSNVLGGCRGTTGPNAINPATGAYYGSDFPAVTIGDMVAVQRRLVAHLGIEKLLAVIGGSMGGHQALCWGTRHSETVAGVVLLGTSPRLNSQSLAFDVVGRNAIYLDPDFNGGNYYDAARKPDVGLAIARMLGHITYLSPQSMKEKFEATRDTPWDIDTVFEKEFSVGSYLAHQGQKFTERFDANSYLLLSMAMDQFDIGGSCDELAASFAETGSRWLIVSFDSDWLFPPAQSRDMVESLVRDWKAVSYCNVDSSCGHDAFLLPDDIDSYGGLTSAFLMNLVGSRLPVDDRRDGHDPTSVFHRLDYERIIDLVAPGDSILDLGAAKGGLLHRFRERGHERLFGVEIDEACIIAGVGWGLNVVHCNLDEGLGFFGDDQFDTVILSRTLQAIHDVEGIVDEMLRVGRRCIISVPNFNYYKLTERFAETGRMPAAALLHYRWYNTPNIRVMTLRDFVDFCAERNVRIEKTIALDTEAGTEIPAGDDPDTRADMAIYVISKGD